VDERGEADLTTGLVEHSREAATPIGEDTADIVRDNDLIWQAKLQTGRS
jgi:hypothetical protein